MNVLNSLSLELVISIVSISVALIGGFFSIQGIIKNIKEDKQKELERVLLEAQENLSLLELKLTAKINENKAEIKTLENSVNKDLNHLKETYNTEIKNLGQKIEQLREELRSQHDSLVTLLTKMIDKDIT